MSVQFRLMFLVPLLIMFAGCPVTVTSNSLFTMRVTPAAITLGLGESQRLTATSTDPDDTFSWTSNAPGVAAVSASGLVTAVSEGNATITVVGTHSQLSKSVPVAVPGVLTVVPAAVVLRPNRIALIDARSTTPGDTVVWSSENPDIAKVDASGIVTGVSEGQTIIEAVGTASKAKSNATVQVLGSSSINIDVTPAEVVLQPKESTTLSATSSDALDEIVWSSSNPGVALVDADGLLTAIADGTTSITAIGTHSIGTGTAFVTVLTQSNGEIVITPELAVLRPTQSLDLTATSADVSDLFAWTSSDTSVVSITPAGRVIAIAEGESTISVVGTSSRAESVATVTVAGVPPATLTVTPQRILVRPGRNALLSATSSDSEDAFEWTSSDTSLATVNSNGIVTGIAEGEVAIIATGTHSRDFTESRVTVSGMPPADITLTPVEFELEPTQSTTLTAASTNANDSFTWFSSDNRYAIVDDNGKVTAISEGQSTIGVRGTISGNVGTAAVRVTGVPPAEVVLSSSQLILLTGRSSKLSATSSDPEDSFTWISSDVAIASVDQNGLVNAVSGGQASITATGSNSKKSGTALVTVIDMPLASITVSPAEMVLRPTQRGTLQAVSSDIEDTFSWSTSDMNIATVDELGIVTGIADGQATIVAKGSHSGATRTVAVTVVGKIATDITVAPDELVLRPTFTATLEATSTDPDDTFTWTSSDDTVASVNASGTVTAVAEGAATITATGSASANTGTTLVTVAGDPPTTITLSPAEIALRPSQTATLEATSTDLEDTFTWSSSGTSVATVDSDGTVTALSAGQTIIVAKGSHSATTGVATVTVSGATSVVVNLTPTQVVLRPLKTATLVASSTDTEDSFTWSSSDNTIATVDSNGLVAAIAEGQTTVTATGSHSGATDTTLVTVSGAPLAEITISPAEFSLHPTEMTTLLATSTDPADVFQWSTSDSRVATVDVNGTVTVTAVAVGQATILVKGNHSGALATASIDITDRPPATVTVTPRQFSLRATLSAPLVATSSESGDGFIWASSNSTIATIDTMGNLTAINEGVVTVTATGTLSQSVGTSTVTVTPADRTKVNITPTLVVLRTAQQTTFNATSTDLQDTFAWSSLDSRIVTIDASGKATAIVPGETMIMAVASVSGVSSTANISVTAAPATNIELSPAIVSLQPTQTTTLIATSTNVEDTFTWSSSNRNVATISATGIVSAIAPGETTITAKGIISAVTGNAIVTVAGEAPVGLSVLPAASTVHAGEITKLSAVSSDPADLFTWMSSNPAVATISPDGTVVGVKEGAATMTARGTNSSVSSTGTVTVLPRIVARIDITPVETVLRVGERITLGATSSDEDDSTFTWSSNDTSRAIVSIDGTVTAIGIGEVRVTAVGNSSGDSGSSRVTVNAADVTISSSKKPLQVGDSEIFVARSTDPKDKSFTWSSSNTQIADVSAGGSVLAKAAGKVTIRAQGTTSGSAGLVELDIVPADASLLLWNGERGYDGVNGQLNSTETFRGIGCMEAIPLNSNPPTTTFLGYPGERADISFYDEIWFFIKADMTGRSTDFQIRSFKGQSKRVNIDGYIEGGKLDLQYRLVRIPISDLKTETFSLNLVENIIWGPAIPSQGHHFFVDEIWAVSLADSGGGGAPLMGMVQPVNFGDVVVGGTSAREVTLTNVGFGPLTVAGLTITGSNKNEFSVSDEPTTIGAGASSNFVVNFNPQSVLSKGVGDKSAELIVAHSHTPMGGSISLPLFGRAISPAISLSKTALNFGEVPVGQNSTSRFYVENPGNAPLTVNSITTFNQTYAFSPTAFTVAGGGRQLVTVTFAPAVEGGVPDTATVTSNAVGAGARSLKLTASGIGAGFPGTLSVSPTDITSSGVTLEWPTITGATSVAVYLGPEPSSTPDLPLPGQRLMATLGGSATEYRITNLAPDVHNFFHVELRNSEGIVFFQGNTYARTPGGPKATLDTAVREVHLIAPDILQIVFANIQVHSYSSRSDVSDGGIEEIVGDIGAELENATWTIQRGDGSPIGIEALHRQSYPVGTPYIGNGDDSTGAHLNLHDVDHFLYFMLDQPIGSREFLTVTGPVITRQVVGLFHDITEKTVTTSFLLPFSDKYLETPVIQLNQMGYSPVATERYAYVSAYLGDGGPMSFSGYPTTARVYNDPANPLDVRTPVGASIPIAVRANPDNVLDPNFIDVDAGTYVREIDLSAVPPAEGVVYRVHIPGVGVSWPTQVSETSVFRSFYLTSRFLTHTRWGRELSLDWTEWAPRPPDHPTVFTSDLDSSVVKFFPIDTPKVGQRLVAGGHHDAADFDINYAHTQHSLNLLRLLELRPDVFLDGQMTIPESGNGIPDLFDEVLYNMRIWEQLQELDGGIRPGFESFGHPSSTNFADLDILPYWTYAREPFHTMRCAGLFAQAATLLRNIAPLKSAEFTLRAVAAYNWALANGVSAMTKGPPMYASGELYRLTGESKYRNLFEQIYDANDNSPEGPSVHPFAPWAGSWFLPDQPILLEYPMGYLLSQDPAAFRVEEYTKRFDRYANDAVKAVATFHAHRNGRNANQSPNFGQATAVGIHVQRIYARLQVGDVEAEDLQRYYNALSLSADYALGGNPLGLAWFSGMGSRSILEPQHADSQTFQGIGFPVLPGIGIYGPRSGLPNTVNYDFGRKLFYPTFEELPLLRRYGDLSAWPGTNEYTIQEVQVPHVRLFGMLLAPGMMPPDTWLPGGAEHRNTLAPREDATSKAP